MHIAAHRLPDEPAEKPACKLARRPAAAGARAKAAGPRHDVQAKTLGRDKTPEMHRRILGVLARAKYEADRKVYGARERENCLQMMRTPEDPEQRVFGSYCSYLLAIDQPRELSGIVDAVRPILNSKEPMDRVAASSALEMLAMASWVARAREDLTELNRIRVLLRTQTSHPEAHIAFAARIGLITLDQLQ
jgi:hypothetical protein